MINLLKIFISILILVSCSKKVLEPVDNEEYSLEGNPAIVLVVENSDIVNSQIEYLAFNSYRAETLKIFSEIFEVSVMDLVNKELTEIIDEYGEPWQINNITKISEEYYEKIIVLNNESARANILIDSLNYLNDLNYTIDLIFCLHGSSENIVFSDNSVKIKEFTTLLKDNNIKLRLLYQTNCKSAQAIDNWAITGAKAYNGTYEDNFLTIFSPQYFLKNWISGLNYRESVLNAFEMEVETLKNYKTDIPILELLLSGNYLAGSEQLIFGEDIKITKDNYIQFNQELP